jgi:hypothetical protein
MITKLQDMLGVKAYRPAPADLAEFVRICGSEKEACEYGDAEAYFRGFAPKARKLFLEKVAKATDIAIEVVDTKPSTKEGGEPINIMEKDTAYIKRVRALGVGDDVLVPLLQAAYDEVGYDLTSSRATGPNKKDKENAAFIMSAIARGESTAERFIANITAINPGLKLSVDADGELDEADVAEAFRVNRLRTEGAAAFA